MFSYQFFHDCSFAPVNCPKKKQKKKKERTLALLLTTLFSNSVLCSHFLFSFSRSSCSFPVPCSPFPILVTSPYKQERMSRRKSDYKGCFIRLELLIIEKKKNKTTKKERNSRLMHHCLNWRLTHYFRILFLSTTFKAHKSHSPSIDWPALDLIFIRAGWWAPGLGKCRRVGV